MNMSMKESVCLSRNAVVRALGASLIFVLTASGTGVAADSSGAVVSPAARQQVENFAKLPLSFEENQGQSPSAVRFTSRGSGYTLFLTADEAILKLAPSTSKANRAHLTTSQISRHEVHSSSTLRMRLVGANSGATVSGLDEQQGKSNYFIGNDPNKWRTNVPNYSRVSYQEEYPGVDLVYYGNQRQLEYDFVVAPGADPRAIAMEIAGESLRGHSRQTSGLSIDANGDLMVSLAGSRVRFHKPVVYQLSSASASVHDSKELVAARWVLKNHNRVGFELAAYDRQKPLIIDPALSFSTYLGGSLDDTAYSIATDSSSNVYVAGTTDSTDFPTQGPLQSVNAGNEDVFVTKLNSTGTALVYSTYLGGSATDFAFALALDSSENVHVVGTTQSTDFPTTSKAFQTSCGSCAGGLPSAFVTELNATGSALIYSTYVGGAAGDSRGYAIALDSNDNAYITGRTSASDFPTTTGALQRALNGTVNVFVSKLNSTGSALAYSTFLGGSGSDQANGIAVDASFNAYVAGSSSSTNFPTTTGAFQTTLKGTSNAIVSKLNNKGSALVYSTYLGGSGADTVWSIRVDTSNDVYVAGQTSSTNFPTTTGAFQTTCGTDCAANDAFVSKFNSAGTSVLYSTFLGGSSEQEAFALAIDSSGDAYVTGRTSSTDFPRTKGSFQTTFGGVFDAYLTELNPTGSGLLYSTYFGGSASDAGLGIAVDAAKNIYLTGRTYSSNLATTPQAFAQTCSTCSATGNEDAFVTKFVTGDQVWPLAINFGSQQVGVKSSTQNAVLSNSGTTTLGITGTSLEGINASEFTASNGCGSSVAAGATCNIGITFTPAGTGTRVATLSIEDSATNSPQTVTLAGMGTNNTVSLTPTSLTFTTQLIGTSSPAQNAILTNTGTATVTVGVIAASGQFSETNNCGTSLAAAASCTISVVFKPTTQGTDKGAVKITDNAAGSPQMLTLAGTATVVSLTPSAVSFGDQKAGTTSAAQTITVMNHGAATLTIKKIAVTGTGAADFAQTNTCGTSLAAGSSCTASVTFTPKTTGSFAALFSVADNGGGTPQSAALTGTGD
jgi:Beta-propeller repeat/Abnormal spindle-like microcephaly-assoc'd, ASPM-SPD-2-Hydin